jgi:outer membrane immunogenic protein
VLGNSKISGSGVTGGAYAGYNWQVNALVLGAEADIEGTSLSPSSSNINFPGVGLVPIVNSDKLPWQASFRGRLGYAAGKALFYGTGGYAVAQIDTKLTAAPGGTDSFSSTVGGWTAGGGIEYALTSNWILRGEYRYTQFNKLSTVLANVVGVPGAAAYQHNITENAGRVGVAYKF